MVVTDSTNADKPSGDLTLHIVPSVRCPFVVHSEAVLIPSVSVSVVWLLYGLRCPLGELLLTSIAPPPPILFLKVCPSNPITLLLPVPALSFGQNVVVDVEICHRSEVLIVVVAVPLSFVPSFLLVWPQVAAVLLQLPAWRARRETFLLLLLVVLSLVLLN